MGAQGEAQAVKKKKLLKKKRPKNAQAEKPASKLASALDPRQPRQLVKTNTLLFMGDMDSAMAQYKARKRQSQLRGRTSKW